MSDQRSPADRYSSPPPEAWRTFLDQVEAAAFALAKGGAAPEPFEKLTLAQFAAGKLAAATHELLRAMTNDRNVDDLAKLAARAWHRASWGISDPLLTVPKVAHSPGADPTQTLFRVAIVKLTAEVMAGGARQGKAALAVVEELRRQQAPQMPDRRTIERWHREANTRGHRLAIFEAVPG